MRWTPPERPRWVTRMNAHAELVGGAEHLVRLDADELVAEAKASTGLDDFGGDEWRSHYAVFMSSLERESVLHLVGRLMVRHDVLRSLRNRLQLVDLWKRRSEILTAAIAPPVVITGTARSGTSILHELMACDPRSRAPAMWEMLHPVEALEGDEPRAAADLTQQFWHDLQPEYETMHANSGELPNECIFIVMNEFLSDQWGGCHVVPSYSAHVASADHHEAYRFHRQFLQTLQQRGTGDYWLLKGPSHLQQLKTLFDVYPDARIVHTHRDPLKTLPSNLSLVGTLKWMRCENVDLEASCEELAKGLEFLFRSEVDQRAAGEIPDDRFIDVSFSDLVGDPVATLGGIYGQLGMSYPAELQQRIESYVRNKPRGSRGAHRYTLEEFGLDRSTERERFRFYQERFAIPDES